MNGDHLQVPQVLQSILIFDLVNGVAMSSLSFSQISGDGPSGYFCTACSGHFAVYLFAAGTLLANRAESIEQAQFVSKQYPT
jgi:hypothetical protein